MMPRTHFIHTHSKHRYCAMIAEIVYHMISMICMSEGDSTDKGLFSAAILAIVCDSVNLFGYLLVLFCSHRATTSCKDNNQGGASALYIIIIFSCFLYGGSISSVVSFFEEDEIFPYNNGEWTSGMVLLLYVNLMMHMPFAFSCCCLQRHHREVSKTYRDDAQREINSVRGVLECWREF